VAGAGIVGQAIAFVTAPILARALGPGGRGTVALLGVYDELSTNLFNAGVPSAVGFATKEGRATVPALLGATRRFSLLLLPVSTLAGVAVAMWPLGDLSTTARIVGFGLVALSPVANTFLIACRNVLMARGDLATLRTLALVQALVRAAAIIGLAVLGWLEPALAAVCPSPTRWPGDESPSGPGSRPPFAPCSGSASARCPARCRTSPTTDSTRCSSPPCSAPERSGSTPWRSA
jgi:hypothetical protein